MNKNSVILVDDQDQELGSADKMGVHTSGALHRAFSVFLFDDTGRHLIQKRAQDKYHTAGLYSNACCSHPAPGELVTDAVSRRLREELGLSCPVRPVLKMRYRVDLGSGLTEHEFDHLFAGVCQGQPVPNPHEVESYKWLSDNDLMKWMTEEPEAFTPWFRLAIREVMDVVSRPTAVRQPHSVVRPDGTSATFLTI